MLFVSAREKLDEADDVSTSGLKFLDVEFPKNSDYKRRRYRKDKLNIKDINKSDFYPLFGLDDVPPKKILILIHGYNNKHESVFRAYHTIERRIKKAEIKYDAIVGFIWAGCDMFLEWWEAEGTANKTAPLFLQLLLTLKRHGCSIDLMTHSLGARVSLKALQNIFYEDDSQKVIDNYFLTAGAIDDDSLEAHGEFSFASSNISNLYIMHSFRDGVLRNIYRIGEGGAEAIGDEGPNDLNNIKQCNAFKIDCEEVISSHGEYCKEEKIYEFMKDALSSSITQNRYKIKD